MPQISDRRSQTRPLKVDCSSDDRIKTLALDRAADGDLLACTLGGLTKQGISTLDDAMYGHMPVELLFAGGPLLLDLESLESREPHTVRIVGHVIGEPPDWTRLQ